MSRRLPRPAAVMAGAVMLLVPAGAIGVAAAGATVRAAQPADFAFVNLQPPSTLGQNAGEPSIGADWTTGKAMYQSDVETLRVTFDDRAVPATATWENVAFLTTSITTLDPILFTDSGTGRTFVSQLTGADSLSAYTDDDGVSWTPSQGGGIPSGVDHQTVGGGPFAPPLVGPVYPHAVYYCSQDVLTSFCAISLDGGMTYGAGIPTWNAVTDGCIGLHGHVKVAPDGTVYVPNQECHGQFDPGTQAVTGGKNSTAVSVNDGLTWSIQVVPDSTGTLRSDPSIGIGANNTVYLGYEDGGGHDSSGPPKIAVSHDRGASWSASVNVGTPFGIVNTSFPEVVAGDDNRVAYAFLGSSVPGDPEDINYTGVWYLYVAMSYDGGASWAVTNVTPGDPVQRGCLAIALNDTCTSQHRNLLDFNDVTVDKQGRVLVGYADGCFAACDTSADPAKNTLGRHAVIARQHCGKGLFAAYDQTLVNGCLTNASNSFNPSAPTKAAGSTPTTSRGADLPPALLLLGVLLAAVAVAVRPRAKRDRA